MIARAFAEFKLQVLIINGIQRGSDDGVEQVLVPFHDPFRCSKERYGHEMSLTLR